MKPAQRGEVWFVAFGPESSYEQALQRPAVILQTNHLAYLNTVVVVPTTAQMKRAGFAGTVPLTAGEGGLDRPSVALCFQVRAIDRAKLKHKIGDLPFEKLSAIELEDVFVCGIPS
jgi:mRNA interferase MazF